MAVPGERSGRPRGTLVTVPGEKSWPSVGRSSCPLTLGPGQDLGELLEKTIDHALVQPARLVDAAYERRSLAISSNLHPSGFDQLMDRTIATALVDRLLHHAHVLVTDGDSIRLADALAGKGVTPLA